MLAVLSLVVFSGCVGLWMAGYEYRAMSFRGLSWWVLVRESVLMGLFLAVVWPLVLVAAVVDWLRSGR